MMPQFTSVKNKAFNARNVALGLYVFSIGLFKKVIIADGLAEWAARGFDGGGALTMVGGWTAALSYTLQIYFDFSGYTDMAIGSALLFNIVLPENFNSPYRATNIREFWRRWHMTLTRFLRDYVYIPLGGSRAGDARTYINLAVTVLIGGVWHGAGWMFIAWGLLHGTALAAHRLWEKTGLKMHWAAGWFITFNFIVISWVFFRAKEMKDAVRVLRAMAGMNGVVTLADGSALARYIPGASAGINILGNAYDVSLLMFVLGVTLFVRNSGRQARGFVPDGMSAAVCAGMAVIAVLRLNRGLGFLF